MKPVGRVGIMVVVAVTLTIAAGAVALLPRPGSSNAEVSRRAATTVSTPSQTLEVAPVTQPSTNVARSPDRPPPPTTPRVGIVGDSLVALSEDEVRLIVGRGRELTIDARPGATIADQTGSAWSLDGAGEGYDALLVELGTNDVIQPGDGAAALRSLAAGLTETPCVIFYSVVAYPDASFDEGRAINAAMIRLATARGDVHASDWSTLFTSDVDFVNPRDGIHPTAAGSRAMAELFNRDLTAQCGLAPRE